MADDAGINRDFVIKMNLTGVEAAAGGGAALPAGYYKGPVKDMYVKDDKPNRCVIQVAVGEGEFSGIKRTTGLSIPKDDVDKVRHYWRAFAESCGYTTAQLDKGGQLSLKASYFIGRACHWRYTPKDENDKDSFDSVVFLAPTEWNQQKQVFDATPAETRTTQRTTTTARKPTTSATSKKEPSLGEDDFGDNSTAGTATAGNLLDQLGSLS